MTGFGEEIGGSVSSGSGSGPSGGVSQLVAGENITLDPTDGTGVVTVTSTASGSGDFPTFTGSGSPQGVVTATQGQSYQDTDTGALYYYIDTGPGNTFWTTLAGEPEDLNTISGLGFDGGGDLYLVSTVALVINSTTGSVEITGTTAASMSCGSAELVLNSEEHGGSTLSGGTGTLSLIGESSGEITIYADGIATTPTDSDTATTALGQPTVGEEFNNTADYDVSFSINIRVVSSTAGSLTMGVASGTPTPVAATPTLIAGDLVHLSGVLPSGYELLIGTGGTIVVDTPVAVFTPL